ncbi:MAG: aldehyde dehydrogenase family protein [Alphaproteobacteria bacterium]
MDYTKFYIDGEWVDPVTPKPLDVINPATEEPCATISDASVQDAEKAIMSARKAFPAFSRTTKAERLDLLRNLLAAFEARSEDIAQAISREMGSPITFARTVQTKVVGAGRIEETIAALEEFEEETTSRTGATKIVRQPIGVCAMITPWNYPINQIAQKAFPALAVGCTMVVKPSVLAPLDAVILAECIHEAGYPPGVFNLIQGEGAEVGQYMASHKEVDFVSLTGSVRAGSAVAKAAADSVKRVTLELGGKSPNVIFSDADLAKAAKWGVSRVMANSGQTCTAPTRMLVEKSVYDQVVDLAAKAGEATEVGDPSVEGNHIGPVVSKAQYERVQAYIEKGIEEGARLVTGGPGRPEGTNRGYFVRPTIFADVTNDMTIARDEIFGPVLSIIPFDGEDDAIQIANDTPYGLAAHVFTGDPEKAQRVALSIDSGMVGINGVNQGLDAPFGGFKQSGNGREGSLWGLEEYTEIKTIAGV